MVCGKRRKGFICGGTQIQNTLLQEDSSLALLESLPLPSKEEEEEEKEEEEEEEEEFGLDIPPFTALKESQSGSHSPFPSSPTTNTL